MKQQFTLICALWLGLSLTGVGSAQSDKPMATPTEPSAQPRKLVFVPVEELQALVKNHGKWILLQKSEFDALYAKAQQAKPSPELTAPGLSHVTYAGRIVDDQLLLTATVELSKFGTDWQTLELDLHQLALEKALLGDRPAIAGRQPDHDNKLVLLLKEPGRHKLTLELSCPFSAVGSDKLAAFALPSRWPGELVLDVPAGKHLQWNGVPVERPAPDDQPAQYRLAVGGQKQLELRLTDLQTTRGADGLVFATTVSGLRAAPEEVTWQAITGLQVFGQPIDQVQLRVPETLQIVSVASSGLDRWEFGAEGPVDGEVTLNLVYRQSFQENREITLQGVMASKTEEGWQAPTLKIANVASHITQVKVTTAPGMRLQLDEATGVQRTDSVGDPDSPGIKSFQFQAWREDYTLRLTTQTRSRELSAAIVTLLELGFSGIDLQCRATVQTRYAPLFETLLSLPAEWQVSEVLVNDQPAIWELVPQEAGVHLVRVSFATPLAIDQHAVIQLKAHFDPPAWPPLAEPNQIAIPDVRVMGTSVVEGTLAISAEQDLVVVPADVQGLFPAVVAEELQARLGYEYQDTHYSGVLQVSRKPTRLMSRALAYHRLDKENLHSHLATRIFVAGGGTQQLQISLPESVDPGQRFEEVEQAARIVEQHVSAPAEGRRIWTVVFDQRVRDNLTLWGNFSQARGALDEFVLPDLRVVGAERETAMIAVEAEPDQQVTVTAVDAGGLALPEMDPADLTLPDGTDSPLGNYYRPHERIVAAYHSVLPGGTIRIKEQRFERLAVPAGIGDRLDIVSILGENGELQHGARLEFRTTGVQSIQISLPEHSDLWATRLDSKPVEVRHTGETYLISLTGSQLAEAQQPAQAVARDVQSKRTLELFYRTSVEPLKAGRQMRQASPEFAVRSGAGSLQPLEILEQHWTLHHPRQIDLALDGGEFEGPRNFRISTWLGRLRTHLEVTSLFDLAYRLMNFAGMLLFLWILAQAVQKLRELRLLGAGLALLFLSLAVVIVLVLFGLSSSVSRRLASQRWDIAPVASETQSTAATRAPASPAMSEAPMSQAEPSPFDPSDERAQRRDLSAPQTPEADKQLGAVTEPQPPAPEAAAPGLELPNQALPPQQLPAPQKPAPAGPVGPREEEQAAMPPPAPPSEQSTNLRRGVLSLSVEMDPAADSVASRFQFSGRNQTSRELVLRYQNRTRLSFVMVTVLLLVVLVFWSTRRRSILFRSILALLGVGIPLALVTVVNESYFVILNGILAGTVLGCGFWLANMGCQTWNRCWRWMNRPLAFHAILMCGVLTGIGNIPLSAQETKQDNSYFPPAPLPQPVIDQNAIIVPYEKTTDPQNAERILLPHDKFLELWRQAHPEEEIPSASPLAATLAESLYTAERVAGANGAPGDIQLTARYVAYNLRDGQVTLPLPLGNVAVREALLDGKAAPLVSGTGSTPLSILLSTPGAHVIDLRVTLPVVENGPVGQFSLELAPTPTGLLQFKLPADGLMVRVNGNAHVYRRAGQGADAMILLPVGSGGRFQIGWQPQQQRDEQVADVQVESTTGVVFSAAGVRLVSHWKYQLRQGGLSEVNFSLPENLAIRTISGQDVGGWEIAGEGAERQLKVFLRRQVSDTTSLQFDLFLTQPADDVETVYAIPQFAPLNVARETGTIGLLASQEFNVRPGTVSGLSQIDAAQMPLNLLGELPGGLLLAYRFASRPWQLEPIVNRRLPHLRVTGQHLASVNTRRVDLQSEFTFNILGGPRTGLTIVLPQGYSLVAVTAPDVAEWYISGRTDSTQMDSEAMLSLEFPQARTGTCTVTLIGKSLRKSMGQQQAEVSLPYPLDTEILNTDLLTSINSTYTATPGELESWASLDPGKLQEKFQVQGGSRTILAYRSDSPAPAPILFTLKEAAARLSGQVLTLLTVREESLDLLLALQWKILSASTNTFQFTAPDWLAGKLDFPSGNGPRRRSIEMAPVGGGLTRWTITLEDPQQESFFIVASATLPPSPEGDIVAPNVQFEERDDSQDPPQFTRLESQQQYIVLVNQSQARLTSLSGAAVEPIQAEDLTQAIKVRQDLIDQAAELVRVREPLAVVSWKQERFRAEQQLPAAVNLADLTTVIASDNSWRTAVKYHVKNRHRQFMALKLPENSEILSVFVKGSAARPVDAGGTTNYTLIPLPKTVEGDVSFPVTLVVAGQLSHGPLQSRDAWLRREITIPVPEVVTPEENRDYGIPVSQTTWRVFLPADHEITVIRGAGLTNFESVTTSDRLIEQSASLLADVSDLIAVNGYTSIRRAQAQSLSNLIQLKSDLQAYRSYSTDQYAPASGKLSQLKKRAAELDESIDKVLQFNSQRGLRVESDGRGNTLVIDTDAATDGTQEQRIEQFYLDNSRPLAPAPVNGGDNKAFSETAAKSDQSKGSVNRSNLRNLNKVQLESLAQTKDEDRSLSDTESQSNGAAPRQRQYQFAPKQQGLDVVQRNAAPPGLHMGGGAMGGPMGGGGMGGMGGGMGGMVAGADERPVTGGLSLEVNLPTDGQELNFSKVGGGGRLVLGIRPRDTWERLLGTVWSLALCGVLAWLVVTLTRSENVSPLFTVTPWALTSLGTVLFFLARSSSILSAWGLASFSVGFIWLLLQHYQRRTRPAR